MMLRGRHAVVIVTVALALTGCGSSSPPPHAAARSAPAIVPRSQVDFASWARQLNQSDTGVGGSFTYGDTTRMYPVAVSDCRQSAAEWRSRLLGGGNYALNRIETVYVCPGMTRIVDANERSVLAEVHKICGTPLVQRTAQQEAAIANWRCH